MPPDPTDPDEPRSTEGSRLWRGMRTLLFGEADEPTLREELAEAIEEHEGEPAAKGDLSPHERQMLRNLLSVGDLTVGEIAVPRGEIVAVPADISFDALVKLVADEGHSRFPVYGEDLDEITGMVHIKDVFARLTNEGPPQSVTEILREPLFVPESMGVFDLLARMRAERRHLAIVVDEFGGTDGLVTIEDAVEVIVGEIEDEHDEVPPSLLWPVGHNVWDADARVELDEVASTVDPRLGEVEEDVDTLGGLAFVLAGRVLEPGESVQHPSGWTLEATDAEAGRRVTKVRLHPPTSIADAPL